MQLVDPLTYKVSHTLPRSIASRHLDGLRCRQPRPNGARADSRGVVRVADVAMLTQVVAGIYRRSLKTLSLIGALRQP